jgi:hypothetical protein
LSILFYFNTLARTQTYFYPEIDDVKKDVPTGVHDVEPAITSIDEMDLSRVEIDHRPQPKGAFHELQRRGLRITDYKEDSPK